MQGSSLMRTCPSRSVMRTGSSQAAPRNVVAHVVAAPAPSRQEPSAPHVPAFEPGQTVWGTVVASNPKGARVQLHSTPAATGFMPADFNPSPAPNQEHSNDSSSPHARRHGEVVLPVGLTRSFQVRAVPQDGRGPLLSASHVDNQIFFYRMQQAMDLGVEDHRTHRVKVLSANNGGVVCSLLSYGQAFLPYSHLARPPPHSTSHKGWNKQVAENVLVGAELDVAIIEVNPDASKVVVSERAGEDAFAARVYQQGNVVQGSVSKVLDFGVVVTLRAPRPQTALLHRSRISSVKAARDLREHFEVGDPIYGLLSVAELDREQRGNKWRLELSTAELEQQPGDLLSKATREECFERVKVFVCNARQ